MRHIVRSTISPDEGRSAADHAQDLSFCLPVTGVPGFLPPDGGQPDDVMRNLVVYRIGQCHQRDFTPDGRMREASMAVRAGARATGDELQEAFDMVLALGLTFSG